MPRKVNEQNERVKRAYLHHLEDALGRDQATVVQTAEAILRFEQSTGHRCFKRFHKEDARAFKRLLGEAKSPRTGTPLSKATVSSILRANKAFFQWLSREPGYKSRIDYRDAEYFNQNTKDARVAHASRTMPYPTLKQCRHAFDAMPDSTLIEIRNKALFACLMITGARDGALSSLRIKHVDLIEGYVFQDARDVRTKGAKTFKTFFLPVEQIYRDCFEAWVHHLRDDLLFGHEDPLFPPPRMGHIDGHFQVTGLKCDCYSNANAIRAAIKSAFTSVGLPQFAPHSFRKTLVGWADKHYPSREAFKAFSQNIGHDSIVTSVSAYLQVSEERQAELIRREQT